MIFSQSPRLRLRTGDGRETLGAGLHEQAHLRARELRGPRDRGPEATNRRHLVHRPGPRAGLGRAAAAQYSGKNESLMIQNSKERVKKY